MRVEALLRYPVKGLSAESLAASSVGPGRGIAGDRILAFAKPGTVPHAAEDVALLADPALLDPAVRSPWVDLRKHHFLQLMQDEAMANLRSTYDAAARRLTLRDAAGALLAEGEVTNPEQRAALEEAVARVGRLGRAPRLVFAPGVGFADSAPRGPVGLARISLINRASVAAFAAESGRAVGVDRFRGNLLLDGAAPWAEFAWVGARVKIGEVTFLVEKRIDRCPATEVNPETAARDVPVPKLLQTMYGHLDMGVFLQAETAGVIRPGDRLAPIG
jgi:hypothetical protein